jgi:hypothetical protein
MDKKQRTHKLIATTSPLTSDAMSSDNSEDERNNATSKLGRQGYLFEEDYQSCRKSSQGKRDHSQRDER